MAASEAEEEALAIAYCGNNIISSNYYVQSPSCSSVVSLSHTDHQSDNQLLLLPYHSHYRTHRLPQQPEQTEEEEENIINQQVYPSKPTITSSKGKAFQLSRCSSSGASIDSLAQQENIDVRVHLHHGHHSMTMMSTPKKLWKNDGDNEDDEDEDYGYYDNGFSFWWWKYFSFTTYPASYFWISLQLLWRFFLSFTVALLVFYLATKPLPPHVSVQVAGVKQFELAEGVDTSGVSTNFLNCNISMGLVIDNKSKVFGLAILSPLLVDVYFGRLPLVYSQEAQIMSDNDKKTNDEEIAVTTMIRAHERKGIKVNVGTIAKAMYGAGRDMEDMLKSGQGLTLLVSLSLSSYYDYRFIDWLIHPTFHHHARCLLFLVNNSHHSKHRAPTFNSTCSLG